MKKLKLLTGLFFSAILTINATVAYGAVTADANYNTLKTDCNDISLDENFCDDSVIVVLKNEKVWNWTHIMCLILVKLIQNILGI